MSEQETPYASPEGFHRHRCAFCGFVWEHHDANDVRHGQAGAHECPGCHRCNWSLGIYAGVERPRVTNGLTPAFEADATSPLNRPEVDEYAEPASAEYAIQGEFYGEGERAGHWREVAAYATLDEAQLAFADSRAFPLVRKYRIVEQRVVS